MVASMACRILAASPFGFLSASAPEKLTVLIYRGVRVVVNRPIGSRAFVLLP